MRSNPMFISKEMFPISPTDPDAISPFASWSAVTIGPVDWLRENDSKWSESDWDGGRQTAPHPPFPLSPERDLGFYLRSTWTMKNVPLLFRAIIDWFNPITHITGRLCTKGRRKKEIQEYRWMDRWMYEMETKKRERKYRDKKKRKVFRKRIRQANQPGAGCVRSRWNTVSQRKRQTDQWKWPPFSSAWILKGNQEVKKEKEEEEKEGERKKKERKCSFDLDGGKGSKIMI